MQMKQLNNIILFIFIFFIQVQFSKLQCNDWQIYKDTKCYKIIENGGLQTFDDAVNTCNQQTNGSNIIMINSTEELNFLQSFIFTTQKIVDNVWIGAKFNNNQYRWINGLNLTYTNWAEGYPKNLADNCVELNADPGTIGKWVDVSCKRRNIVVCEKEQTWSVPYIQKIISNLRELVNNLQETVTALKQTQSVPFPIGYIYIQFPNKKSPKEIWPWMSWNDITNSYAGLFFRAEGGNSSSFGSIQNENSPRITEHQSDYLSSHSNSSWSTNMSIGEWSNWVLTGENTGEAIGSRFFTSGGEVRPRNTAIRVWERYG